MIALPRLLASATAVALCVAATSVANAKTRADCEREYTPQRAQDGKDVIWAPTPDAVVLRMLELAKVAPADKVYDLGAGDGKIAIAAGKHFGATAVGVEYDADLVQHARCLAEAEGVQARVTFVQGDIFETDFSDATVVALYLVTEVNLRLRPALLEMAPGTRVVSYSFTMGDWRWDDHIDTDEGSAYLWIVPADVDGSWTFHSASGAGSFTVELEQAFQNLRGTTAGASVTGRLSGDRVSFAFMQGGDRIQVDGVVNADRITATVTRGAVSAQLVGTRH